MSEIFDFSKLDGIKGLDTFGPPELPSPPMGITQALAIQRVQELLAEQFGATWFGASVASVSAPAGYVHFAFVRIDDGIAHHAVVEDGNGEMMLADKSTVKSESENAVRHCQARISWFLINVAQLIAQAKMSRRSRKHLLQELMHVHSHVAEL